MLIEVADEGAGILPEDQTRLFNRFFRSAYAADQAVAGSGLGLAISKALVEVHGGTIGVESKSGGLDVLGEASLRRAARRCCLSPLRLGA